jgi:hypothetical protein
MAESAKPPDDAGHALAALGAPPAVIDATLTRIPGLSPSDAADQWQLAQAQVRHAPLRWKGRRWEIEQVDLETRRTGDRDEWPSVHLDARRVRPR